MELTTLVCSLLLRSPAGLKATRGDDVYHEDETTAALEDRIARMTGKEAAMFCVSGTMTNRTSTCYLPTDPS